MACWRAIAKVGLVLALAGCGNGSEGEGAPEPGGDGPAGDTTTTGGTTTTGEDEAGVPGGTTFIGGESSGSVEETLFGMSDDMPLVADIPDIKRGEVARNTWVAVERVRVTTGSASRGSDAWFYVQDLDAEQHMGLRVVLQPGDTTPSDDRVVDLVGWVHEDAQGWLLELESMVEGSVEPAVEPRGLPVATLRSEAAFVYDDALVELDEVAPLVVTRRGPVPGTVFVGAVGTGSGNVLVDLRPFGLDLDLPPGTYLSRMRGVAELGSSRPVILPRDTEDLVVAR